jgi:urate oxidase
MGEAGLAAVPEVAEISMACPNKHYLPINLSPFGMSADNMVFTATDEPHGQIECTVGR